MTKGLNRSLILGRDWLKKNNVRFYFDLGLMRIDGRAGAELKENLHISTIVRTPKKLMVKPNTVTVFYGNVNNNFPFEDKYLVEVNSIIFFGSRQEEDGSDRICFRSFNKIVRPVSFPLPLIDDNPSMVDHFTWVLLSLRDR